jgi:hypothetical protein
MTHRAQQVVDAMKAELSANTAISWSVYRQRVDDLDVSEMELPAVTVDFSQDLPLSDLGASNLSFIDSLLTVEIVVVAEGGSQQQQVIDQLMEMRRQVHITLMADITQGLAFVINTRYGGAEAPILNNDADRIASAIKCLWHVHYRMNIFDPS